MQQGQAEGKVVIVTGPTAGGKSALAVAVARAFDGVIINADSMQLYRELRILTARPSPEEEAEAPHRLYGVLSVREAANAAWWRRHAIDEIEATLAAGKLPILTGGTGLYLRALTEGLSGVPETPPKIREETRRLLKEIGSDALYEKLAAADPVMGERLRPSDSQRLARAWEVLRATGRSLAEWQDQKGEPAPYAFYRIAVLPEREALRAAIAARFEKMLEAGVLEEVRALAALDLDPDLPAMKALGAPELMAHLRGEISLEEAARAAITASRRYAKRQVTWLRGELERNNIITEIISEKLDKRREEKIFTNLRKFQLTP